MVIHKIKHHIKRFHKVRKRKDEELPHWKENWHQVNEHYLSWLEKFVEKAIPWMVLLLLIIILGEFANYLNFFNWHWVDSISEFFHHNEDWIQLLDQFIIVFFVIDLYFSFFKKATFLGFLKYYILDIIAVAPFGLIFRVSEIGEAQSILHVTTDLEREASRVLKGEEAVSKIIKSQQEIAKLTRMQKLTRFFTRLPRFLRLYRITEFLGITETKKVKKSNLKKRKKNSKK